MSKADSILDDMFRVRAFTAFVAQRLRHEAGAIPTPPRKFALSRTMLLFFAVVG